MQTIDQLIHRSCLDNTDRAALAYKKHGSWKEISYAKLWDTVEKLANGLRDLELDNTAHIALIGPSSPRWVASYLAILHAGYVAVPIDKELKANELRHILYDADVQAIFVGPTQFEILLEIIEDLPKLKKTILFDKPLVELGKPTELSETLEQLTTLWQQLVKEQQLPLQLKQAIEEQARKAHALLTSTESPADNKALSKNILPPAEVLKNKLFKAERLFTHEMLLSEKKCALVPRQPEQTAVILYTSGTTGRAKGAMLSHANIVTNILAASERFQLDNTIRTLSFLPINHVFEQVCGILLPLSLGGKVSFAESLKKLGDNLAEVKPSFLLAVPAVYKLLLERINKNINAKTMARLLFNFAPTRRIVSAKVQKNLGKGTTFISGGAALDPEIVRGFQKLGIKILQGYGITETSPVISAESPFKAKPGTVGTPLTDIEVRIDKPNSDGEGEILVKGPNVMLGYYKNEPATAEAIRDGWYHTGDLGRIDEDGMLHICGRLKNLIVTPNGKNVYPEEVEEQLLKSPYIAEIMVYGHKVSPTAEEVYAVIYPDEESLFALEKELNRGPHSVKEVEALLRKEIQKYGSLLADYKRVKKFTLREDEFPKTTTRKIKRYAVEAVIATE